MFQAEGRSAQLQHALDRRILIEQAKGLLAERHAIEPTEAFAVLRRHARDPTPSYATSVSGSSTVTSRCRRLTRVRSLTSDRGYRSRTERGVQV